MNLRDDTYRDDSSTELSIGSHKTREPLRECVRNALASYFHQMNGHDVCDLYQMVITEVEPPLLEAVMRETGGNQSRAAVILGISRSTLRKKLALYGLD